MTTLLSDAEDTVRWGERLAGDLAAGSVLLLFGPLGVGKTTLVRGVARGLGYPGPVLSPTFTLLEVYPGRLPIYHFDFYRINGPEDVRAADPREYFDIGVTLIEWPERVRAWWPSPRVELRLEFDGPGRRLEEQRIP